MFEKLQKRWFRLRKNYWLSLGVDAGLLILVFLIITTWQNHELLPESADNIAPDFVLADLDGQFHSLQQTRGRETLLYFFSPWCHICNLSAHNLEAIRRARRQDELAIYLVAIGWQDIDEVREFAERHQLTIPVLLGNAGISQEYRIMVTPTYYVLDTEGRVRGRSVGYSSELGLRWRT
jgi:peroxiredoxin